MVATTAKLLGTLGWQACRRRRRGAARALQANAAFPGSLASKRGVPLQELQVQRKRRCQTMRGQARPSTSPRAVWDPGGQRGELSNGSPEKYGVEKVTFHYLDVWFRCLVVSGLFAPLSGEEVGQRFFCPFYPSDRADALNRFFHDSPPILMKKILVMLVIS